MPTPSGFPVWLAHEKEMSIGPVKLWRAPYQAAGGEAATEDIKPMGILSNDGIELDHKVTYAHAEVQQLTYALRTALTKQELDLKFTVQHLKREYLSWFLGLPNNPYTADPGGDLFGFGEPMDTTADDDTASPCMEPPYGQWIMQFSSPGLNFETTPKCGYAYLRLFKAAVISHGSIKFTKTGYASVQCTLKAFADLSVTGTANKVGEMLLLKP